MELPCGHKSFKIGLAVQTQYRRITDSHLAISRQQRPRYTRCVTRVKKKISARKYNIAHLPTPPHTSFAATVFLHDG